MNKVTVIQPTLAVKTNLRVAAYCRVSSDSADQLHSYAAQIKAYTAMVGRHEGWQLVDIYADEGITGTDMEKRDDFKRMLSDCRKGRIDKILVKSISRFARNTRDCLVTLRELAARGVSVQFEKENIDTGALTTEMLVSVFASMAQEESISISQNQRMSYQRRMERGEFITCSAPFGYRLVNGKNLEIDENEARLVRWIFSEYLNGKSTVWLAEQMELMGIPTTAGMKHWYPAAVRYILTNEKYIGDTLCQKFYMAGFPFRKKPNKGERDQYYVENTHPAIISREIFDKAQKLRLGKDAGGKKVHKKYLLSCKMFCGECGSVFERRLNRKSGNTVWVCQRHDERAADCSIGRVAEPKIYAAFVKMYNKLRQNIEVVLQPALKQLAGLNEAMLRDNPAMLEINKAIADTAEQEYKLNKLQTAGLLDADACIAKTRSINARLLELRAKRRRLLENEEIEGLSETLRQTIGELAIGPEKLVEFDENIFRALVERITVESNGRLIFKLYGGIELPEEIGV